MLYFYSVKAMLVRTQIYDDNKDEICSDFRLCISFESHFVYKGRKIKQGVQRT